jgi:hypothetical protein
MRCTTSRKPAAAELTCARHAQSNVREARRLLACPTAATAEESAQHVEAAITCLETLRTSLRSRGAATPAGLAAELDALQKEIFHTTALLERAAAFYFSWARLLYAAACGYTAAGEPASPGPVRRLSVEG